MAEQAQTTALAIFKPPRLPFHPAIEERLGVSPGEWKVLVEAVFPSAKSADAVVMAINYCAARKLDIFKRVVHIVPVWDSKAQREVETVWPGIAEHRTTAMRTRQYAGCDEIEFGPEVTEDFEWETEWRGAKQERRATVTYPSWARLTVYKFGPGGVRYAVPGPKVFWKEECATNKQGVPNDMWRKRPHGQVEKVAEAFSLRRAFPEELGDEPTAEEMHGREVEYAPDAPAPLTAGFKPQRSPHTAENTGGSDGPEATGDGADAPPEAQDAEFEDVSPELVDQETGEVNERPTDRAQGAGSRTRPSEAATPASGGGTADGASGTGATTSADVKSRPTETASAPSADAKAGSSGSATGASTGSAAETSSQTSHGEPSGSGEEDESKTTASVDEVYLLAGETFDTEDGKRPTWKNGKPFSRVSEKGAAKLDVHDFHPAAPEPEEFPGDKPREEPSGDMMADARSRVLEAPSWLAMKQVGRTLAVTDDWKALEEEGKRMFFLAMWERYEDLVADGKEDGDVTVDWTLMRIWLEHGAKTAKDIEDLWPTFWRRPAYRDASDEAKRLITDTMSRRKTELGGK